MPEAAWEALVKVGSNLPNAGRTDYCAGLARTERVTPPLVVITVGVAVSHINKRRARGGVTADFIVLRTHQNAPSTSTYRVPIYLVITSKTSPNAGLVSWTNHNTTDLMTTTGIQDDSISRAKYSAVVHV